MSGPGKGLAVRRVLRGLQRGASALVAPVPDILRRVFFSSQTWPAAFTRGFFRDPRKVAADAVPCYSLWCKTNVALARRSLDGIRFPPDAGFIFLKDVARTAPARAAVH